jgi:hypothetical protein
MDTVERIGAVLNYGVFMVDRVSFLACEHGVSRIEDSDSGHKVLLIARAGVINMQAGLTPHEARMLAAWLVTAADDAQAWADRKEAA